MSAAQIASYRAAVAADPSDAKAHCNLGVLLFQRQDVDGAEASLRAAIAADPSDANAHYNLGSLLQEGRNDAAGAITAYLAAVAADSGHAEAHENLGIMHAKQALTMEESGGEFTVHRHAARR